MVSVPRRWRVLYESRGGCSEVYIREQNAAAAEVEELEWEGEGEAGEAVEPGSVRLPGRRVRAGPTLLEVPYDPQLLRQGAQEVLDAANGWTMYRGLPSLFGIRRILRYELSEKLVPLNCPVFALGLVAYGVHGPERRSYDSNVGALNTFFLGSRDPQSPVNQFYSNPLFDRNLLGTIRAFACIQRDSCALVMKESDQPLVVSLSSAQELVSSARSTSTMLRWLAWVVSLLDPFASHQAHFPPFFCLYVSRCVAITILQTDGFTLFGALRIFWPIISVILRAIMRFASLLVYAAFVKLPVAVISRMKQAF
jgi:hypothetical protein